jgi:transcriptional regulator with XRE-family HTH domain
LQLFLCSGGARQRPFHKQNSFCGFASVTTYSRNRILHTQLPVAKFDEFSVNGILQFASANGGFVSANDGRPAKPRECRRMPPSKAPNPVDKHVGSRVRMRRLMLEMSQEKLGEALGLTFQQIQKYEKGTNRIGASRIQQIADILQVPVAFLFEGASGAAAHAKGFSESASTYVSDVLATSEGLAMVRAFGGINNVKLRRKIVEMIEQIIASEPPGKR